jgi:hypothetical protein
MISGAKPMNLPYCGWLRNPASPTGWLKPYKEWDKPDINW